MTKVIVVFLGTGAQAAGLVAKCLADPDFTPRIVTRDPDSEKAKALVAQGAQAVKADLNEPLPAEVFATAEGETLYGVFAVTDFWNSAGLSAEKEIAQGKNIADHIPAACEHIVFSTLADTRPALAPLGVKPLQGDYTVPHLDSKAVIDGFFPADKTTFLETAFYYQNFDGFGMCSNGVLTLPIQKKLAAIDSADIGHAAYHIFKDPTFKGKRLVVAGETLTGAEYCQIMSDVTGKAFTYNGVDYDTYSGFGFPGAEELSNMMRFWDETGHYGDPATTRAAVCPELRSFRDYCEANKERIAKMAAP